MAVYIHVPFCKTICTYCDFCKLYKNDNWIKLYLSALDREIKENYKGEKQETIYIGGGTPNCLNDYDFNHLLDIVDIIKRDKFVEYTVECNVDILTEEQIKIMVSHGVNRVSLGVETFNPKFMKLLGRHHTIKEVKEKVELLKKYGIYNINIDLMYAFCDESTEDLKNDIDEIIKLSVPHISTYSLMIEPHTILYTKGVKQVDEELDYEMYETILQKLFNYNHYEVSNFALTGYESKHNLTYWNNEEYYGFGLSASGYINKERYTNTKNLFLYLKNKYKEESHILSKQEQMENEMILGLRKMEGVSISKFKKIYGIDISDYFEIDDLVKNKKLLKDGDYIKINPEYIYTSNDILINFIKDEI